jgi:hypothetical protein
VTISESPKRCGLDIGTLLGMPLQIPAGNITGAREERVDASLRLRWVEQEYDLAAFLLHGIVAGDGDLSKAFINGYAITENSVIQGVGGQQEHGQR